jgi:hypothetical protein
MRVVKSHMTRVDLQDPNDIFNPNLQDLAQRILDKRYNGVCYQGILVDSVEILEMSDVEFSRTLDDGSAFLDCRIKIGGIALVPGEVVHGCKITKVFDRAMLGETDDFFVKIPADRLFTSFLKEGHRIPVVVENSAAVPNHEKITIRGSIYRPTPEPAPLLIKITAPITPEQKTQLDEIHKEIRDELAWHGEQKKNPYEFFEDLVYPYPTAQNLMKVEMFAQHQASHGKAGFRPVPLELKQIMEISQGTVAYSDKDPVKAGRLWHSPTPMTTAEVEASAFSVCARVLMTYLQRLQSLRGFVENYGTKDQFTELSSYWAVCKLAKAGKA